MTLQIIATKQNQSFTVQPVMMRSMMMSLTIPEAIPR